MAHRTQFGRALRRHHRLRLWKKRREYLLALFASHPKRVTQLINTPCVCSCWLCGHSRRHFGPGSQELRQLRHSSWQLTEVGMLEPASMGRIANYSRKRLRIQHYVFNPSGAMG